MKDAVELDGVDLMGYTVGVCYWFSQCGLQWNEKTLWLYLVASRQWGMEH